MNGVLHRVVVGLVVAALMGVLAARAAGPKVPLRGQAEGAITELVTGPDGVAITVVSQGNATHLGLFTREERILLDPAAGTFAGSIVFTSADGGQLVGSVAGGFTSPTAAAGTYAFAGGTGRFEGATGDAEFVLSTPDGVHFTATFEGKVAQQ